MKELIGRVLDTKGIFFLLLSKFIAQSLIACKTVAINGRRDIMSTLRKQFLSSAQLNSSGFPDFSTDL